MKRILYKSILLLLFISACLLCFSCANNTLSEQQQESIDVEYAINYYSSEGGYIQGNDWQIVKEGQNGEEVTAVPLDGYVFVEWSDGNTNSIRKEYNVHDHINEIARFVKVLSVEYTADDNGYIESNSSQSIVYGNDAATVTAVPNTGYDFLRWSDGVTENPRQDKNITRLLEVRAIFTKKCFSVKYRETDGGSVYSYIDQIVYYGESSKSVTATPDPGYEFVGWNDGVTDATRSDSNISSDFTVTAIFKKKNYTVKYVASLGGHIDGKKTQSVPYLEQADPVTAVADEGFKFVRWESDYSTSMQATRTDTISQDITFTAIFEKSVYDVDYFAKNGGHIVGEDFQKIPHGENSKSVTAVADDGYEFIGWNDGVTDATRSECNVTRNIMVSAVFDRKPMFAGGAGTLYDPYLIENYEQLLNMRQRPNAAYKLISDLDLNGIAHQPIFDQNLQCQAFLDGDDHTIRNLTVDTVDPFPSLLGVVGNYGRVVNLNIINANIIIHDLDMDSALQRVGILCGISLGGLENITVSGIIHGDGLEKDGVLIGGLAAQTMYGVANCRSNVTVALSDIDIGNGDTALVVGGLVGVASNSFFNCSSTSSITISSREDSQKEIRNAAGLVCHFLFSEISDITVNNCHSQTDISINVIGHKEGGVCGGLINQISSEASVSISNCSAKGSLSGAFAGGLIKLIRGSDVSITKSFFDGSINCYDTAAGFVYDCRPTSDGKTVIEDCYSKGYIKAGRTGCGFFYMVLTNDVTMSKCYSDMEITADEVAGFGHMFAGTTIRQCFTLGNLIAGHYAAGLMNTIGRTMISDCYSCCNITITNPNQTLNVGGLIGTIAYSSITNCYFAGTILCQGDDKSGISVLCYNLSPNTVVENCHWLNIQTEGYNEVVAFGNYRDDSVFIDICSYDSLEEMKYPNGTENLAEILNGDSSYPVWIQRENELPTLKFAVK